MEHKVYYDLKIKGKDITPLSIKKVSKEVVDSIFNDYLAEYKDDKILVDMLTRVKESNGRMSMSGNGYEISSSAYFQRVVGVKNYRCPSNNGQFGETIMDSWDTLGDDLVCSYCGSMHPSSVLKAVKEHGKDIIEATDKSYKIYVTRKGVNNASFGGIKYYRWHDTEEFVKEIRKILGHVD